MREQMKIVSLAFEKWPESANAFWNKFFHDGISIGWRKLLEENKLYPGRYIANERRCYTSGYSFLSIITGEQYFLSLKNVSAL